MGIGGKPLVSGKESDARGDRGRVAITGGIFGGEDRGDARGAGSGRRSPAKCFEPVLPLSIQALVMLLPGAKTSTPVLFPSAPGFIKRNEGRV